MEDISISGVVNDEDGNPLPGATILVKGSSEGTVTDIDGRYSLNVPDGTEYLTFSFVGYESQTVMAMDGLVVLLVPQTGVLGELIVTSGVIDVAKEK